MNKLKKEDQEIIKNFLTENTKVESVEELIEELNKPLSERDNLYLSKFLETAGRLILDAAIKNVKNGNEGNKYKFFINNFLTSFSEVIFYEKEKLNENDKYFITQYIKYCEVNSDIIKFIIENKEYVNKVKEILIVSIINNELNSHLFKRQNQEDLEQDHEEPSVVLDLINKFAIDIESNSIGQALLRVGLDLNFKIEDYKKSLFSKHLNTSYITKFIDFTKFSSEEVLYIWDYIIYHQTKIGISKLYDDILNILIDRKIGINVELIFKIINIHYDLSKVKDLLLKLFDKMDQSEINMLYNGSTSILTKGISKALVVIQDVDNAIPLLDIIKKLFEKGVMINEDNIKSILEKVKYFNENDQKDNAQIWLDIAKAIIENFNDTQETCIDKMIELLVEINDQDLTKAFASKNMQLTEEQNELMVKNFGKEWNPIKIEENIENSSSQSNLDDEIDSETEEKLKENEDDHLRSFNQTSDSFNGYIYLTEYSDNEEDSDDMYNPDDYSDDDNKRVEDIDSDSDDSEVMGSCFDSE